ncbi:MAG: hypothetical protein PVJ76_13570 [Gemmatimonadota bacterium]|jgi:hypothetical protein
MNTRPTAVTVIGWLWRVGGVLGIVISLPFAFWGQDLFAEYWPDVLLRLSSTALFLWAFFSSLLCFLVGNGMLKGQKWARTLAMAYCVVGTLIAAVLYIDNFLYWFNLMADLAFTAIMWLYLYRSQANAFFRSGEPTAG